MAFYILLCLCNWSLVCLCDSLVMARQGLFLGERMGFWVVYGSVLFTLLKFSMCEESAYIFLRFTLCFVA